MILEVAVALSLVSLASLVLCAFLLPYLVVRLPEDYFARVRRKPPWTQRSVGDRLFSVARTLVGLVLVVTGLFLVVLPGQGLLTILMGIVVAEFPGKFRLERRLVARPGIRRGLDAIRRSFGQPPLLHAPVDTDARGPDEANVDAIREDIHAIDEDGLEKRRVDDRNDPPRAR